MATTTLMSFADFERLEQGADQVELLKGELIRVPPPQKSHLDICERLYDLLKAAVGSLRLAGPLPVGRVHIEMGYRLSGEPSWLRPDVSVTHPDQPFDRYYSGAPLIVFEVVSENDTATRLTAKVAEYLENGTQEVWLIYPELRKAWIYDSSGSARNEKRSIQSPLLPEIEIPLSEIL